MLELKKLLEGVPDDMKVLTYDEGYLTDADASVEDCAPIEGRGTVLRTVWKYSGHSEEDKKKAEKYFVVS